MKRITILLLLAGAAAAANAAAPKDLLSDYEGQARKSGAAFSGFSAERGEALFRGKHAGKDGAEACTTCHTDDARRAGKHHRTGKPIEPLAPSANAERLSDAAKAEKWFRRNCQDVLERECTAQEKGDFVQYLITVK